MSGSNGSSNGHAKPEEPPAQIGPSVLQQEMAAAAKLEAERKAEEARRLAEEAAKKKAEEEGQG